MAITTKLYYQIISLIISLVFVFGFAGPWLVSNKSTWSVWGGITLIVLTIPAAFTLGRRIFLNGKVVVANIRNKEEITENA